MCRSVSGTQAGRIEVSAAASRMWRPSSECQAVGAFLCYIVHTVPVLTHQAQHGQRSAALEQPDWANGYGNVVIGSRAACRRQLPPLAPFETRGSSMAQVFFRYFRRVPR